jgi:hypothetical protein
MRSQMCWAIDAIESARLIFHLNLAGPIIPASSFGFSLVRLLRGRYLGGMLIGDEIDSDWPSRYPPQNSQNHDLHGRTACGICSYG